MKPHTPNPLTLLLALLLSLTAHLTTSAPASNKDLVDMTAACAKQPAGHNINIAITKFCELRDRLGQLTDDLIVPSPYATKGIVYKKIGIMILGTCAPATWVPLDFCLSQFHSMCANGESSKFYYTDNCQQFFILRE